MSSTAWIARAHPNPSARLRLICFPYAGGGDAIFRLWWQSLPDDVEVCAIRLPGRDARRAEPPLGRLTPLVHALADALGPDLARPYALYGHSAGARVAFELAREQRRRGRPEPALLAVSGRRAPHCPERDPLHGLPTDQLVARLRRLGGTPEAILREPELMAMFLPIVRADLAVNEAEAHRPEPPLACPIAAFGGSHDERCTRDELDAWRDHTQSSFSLELFPGGHFFVHTAARDLLASLAQALRGTAAPTAS
ncbi:MAG TPA: thioesterase domain-containing protein [Kofleriaceae bacterium]|nr:thioesterase domain-containing protein [Kofleriaceae bacterium]